MRDFAIAIFGPTGVGKSMMAMELAKDIGEIISVDSMQVYKYMNIGTAKPCKNEQNIIKHHLIDIITPDIQFNAGDFQREAQKLIPEIIKRNKIPFLVGGTGLYFTSLIRGLIEIPKIDKRIKNNIITKWDNIGQKRMYKILKRLDNEYSKNIHPNDKQRTLRALEVIIGTGKKYSYYLQKKNIKNDINYILIGISIDRKELYDIINNRVDKMIEDGLVGEVENLLKMDYKKNDPGIKAIGYKEIIEYIENKISLEEAISNIKKNSRRYAKRQLTWFKKLNNVFWVKNIDIDLIKNYINNKINEFTI